jgi:hypothetical protein
MFLAHTQQLRAGLLCVAKMAQTTCLATQVCQRCKIRKKACDKILPRCGYCTKHELECSYLSSADDAVPAASAPPNDPSHRVRGFACGHWLGNIGLDNTNDALAIPSDGIPILEQLRNSILCSLNVTGQSILAIRDSFVGGIYRWLPIIAPWQLSDAELDGNRKPLPVDTLMLLLSMSLCTTKYSDRTQTPGDWRHQSEYLVVKRFFALSQATAALTDTLLQAGMLVAVYEFASRQPQTAYQTMQTCRGIYDVLGTGCIPTQEEFVPMSSEETLRVLKRCSLARGFTILERCVSFLLALHELILFRRLISLETAFLLEKDLDTLSGSYGRTPPFFEHHPDVDPDILQGLYLEPKVAEAMQSFTGHGFPAMAQAVSFLSSISYALQKSEPVSVKIQDLQSLDAELQKFLATAMEGYRRPGHHCGAIAVGIRQVHFFFSARIHWVFAAYDAGG